jgi:signal transduction histidine kinase
MSFWRIYALVWLPLVAVDVAMFMAMGGTFVLAVRSGIAFELPRAVLGVFVLRTAEAVAELPLTRARVLGRHAATALPYAVASTALAYVLWWADHVVLGPDRPLRFDPYIAGWQTLFNVLLYAALAGVGHARAQGRRIEAESMRAARAEALRARADRALLRSQLNPHFVMNVLHSLVGLVRRDPALAERAIEDLGGLLGYGLRLSREDADRVPLREEWAFVESYLELEKMRLGDRLDLGVEAAPEALACRVPSFSLQPLVENAIVHAIAPRARGGLLGVSARVEGDGLALRVEDDGPGLAADALDGDGLGLRLLRERLAVLYPGRDVLRLTSRPGGGLVVALDLPLENGDRP